MTAWQGLTVRAKEMRCFVTKRHGPKALKQPTFPRGEPFFPTSTSQGFQRAFRKKSIKPQEFYKSRRQLGEIL